jgi:hypothetical protein
MERTTIVQEIMNEVVMWDPERGDMTRAQVYEVYRAGGYTDKEIDWMLFCIDRRREKTGGRPVGLAA